MRCQELAALTYFGFQQKMYAHILLVLLNFPRLFTSHGINGARRDIYLALTMINTIIMSEVVKEQESMAVQRLQGAKTDVECN